jgi:hypothetical protein
MEYIKKNKVVQAVQFKKLNDIDYIRTACPHVASFSVMSDGDELEATLYYKHGDLSSEVVLTTNWVVWNDNFVKVLTDSKFKNKYVVRNTFAGGGVVTTTNPNLYLK